jgi:hypothetical protein
MGDAKNIPNNNEVDPNLPKEINKVTTELKNLKQTYTGVAKATATVDNKEKIKNLIDTVKESLTEAKTKMIRLALQETSTELTRSFGTALSSAAITEINAKLQGIDLAGLSPTQITSILTNTLEQLMHYTAHLQFELEQNNNRTYEEEEKKEMQETLKELKETEEILRAQLEAEHKEADEMEISLEAKDPLVTFTPEPKLKPEITKEATAKQNKKNQGSSEDENQELPKDKNQELAEAKNLELPEGENQETPEQPAVTPKKRPSPFSDQNNLRPS